MRWNNELEGMWKEEVGADIFQLLCLWTRNNESGRSPFESRQHYQQLSSNSWDMHCVSAQNMLTVRRDSGNEMCWDCHGGKTGLHPQITNHFAWQPSARVSQLYGPPTLVTWLQLLRKQTHSGTLHLPNSINTLMYARTNSLTLSISLGSLTAPALAAGDFVTLILL